MFDKLKVAWTWIRAHWKVIAIGAIVVFLLIIGSCRLIRGSVSHQLEKSKETLAVDKTTIDSLTANLTLATKAKKKAEKDIQDIRDGEAKFKAGEAAKTAKAYAERDAAVARIKTLANDELAQKMSAYIFPEFFTAHVDNSFSTTRPGAELTQVKFLDWTARGTKITDLEAAAAADDKADKETEGKRKTADANLAAAQKDRDAAIEKTMKDLNARIGLLERGRLWLQVKGAIKGVILAEILREGIPIVIKALGGK